jgi:hypothetical protein
MAIALIAVVALKVEVVTLVVTDVPAALTVPVPV